MKPDVEATIRVLPKDENPRNKPLSDHQIGHYGCPMILSFGNWDCRMIFPDSNGQISFGETGNALIQFLSPEQVIPRLKTGDKFELWENGVIAVGTITKIRPNHRFHSIAGSTPER